MAEEKDQGDALAPPARLGSIQVDALGTEEFQRQIPTWAEGARRRSSVTLSSNARPTRFRWQYVTDVLVDVPAAMYNEHHRATAEARLTTVTICNDKERGEAWQLMDGTGPGVRLDIGKGVMLECFGGETTPAVVVALV